MIYLLVDSTKPSRLHSCSCMFTQSTTRLETAAMLMAGAKSHLGHTLVVTETKS